MAAIDLAHLDEGWHRPETVAGAQVRWSAREPTLVFDWPFLEPWILEMDLLSHFGAAQIERAEVVAGGKTVALAFRPEAGGGQIRIRGPARDGCSHASP